MASVRPLSDRFARDIDPDMMTDETAALILRAVRALVAANGHGPANPVVVIQQLRLWQDDGKVRHDQLLEAVDLLTDTVPGEEEDVAGALIPVLQQVFKEHAVRAAIQSLSKPTGFEDIIKQFENVSNIGKKRSSTGTVIGRASFEAMARLRNIDKLPTGINALDMTLGGGLPRGSQGVVLGGYGAGKCHAKGQGILMYDGSIKKVEDVVVGDKLVGPDGAPRTVLRTNTGVGEMYDIVPSKGARWRVNADHVLSIVYSGDKTEQIHDISVRNYLKLNKTRKQYAMLLRAPALFGSSSKLPISPYILGVLLGDGSTTDGSVMVTTADVEIKQELEAFAAGRGLRVSVRAQRGAATSYGLANRQGLSNGLIEDMRCLGLFKTNGHRKFVPDIYKSASTNARRHLLAGLIDTDGSHDGRGHYDYISCSKQLAHDVEFLARSVGLAAYLKPCLKHSQNGTGDVYYRVSISGHTSMIPCRISRKKAPVRKQIKDTLHVGFKVVPTGTVEDYYGFSLDGDSRYLLDDFTVTHNSMFLSSQAAIASLLGFNVGYITLELNPGIVSCRIKGALLDMPINEILGDKFEEAERRLNKLLPDIGMVVVEEMTPKKSTHLDIFEWMQRVNQTHGRKIDVLIVDYADKLASPRHKENDSSYQAMETVYEGLRLIADSEGIFEWTASQSQRKAKDKRGQVLVPTGDDAADSMSKPRVTDVLIGLARTADGQGYIYGIDKHRTYDCAGKSVGPVPHKLWCGRMFL